MPLTPHDRQNNWKPFDASSGKSRWSRITEQDLLPELQFLEASLGWVFRISSTGRDYKHQRLHMLCATYMDGLVDFLFDGSYQAIFSGDTPREAQDRLVDALSRGCSACAAFNHSGTAKWAIPHFSTLEELRMKANISGSENPWLVLFDNDGGGENG